MRYVLHISFLFKCFCICLEFMPSLRRLRMPCPDKTPSDKNILFANEDNKYRIISMVLLNLPKSRICSVCTRLCKRVFFKLVYPFKYTLMLKDFTLSSIYTLDYIKITIGSILLYGIFKRIM